MGRQHSKRRSMRIKQAQKRKAKLAKLRQLYKEGKKDKDKILEKVFKIVPWLNKEDFLKPLDKQSSKNVSEAKSKEKE